MEEIVSTESLEREILADARKKAERALRGAEDEIRRVAEEGERKAAQSIAELDSAYAAKVERYRSEALARLPLEKSRIKAAYVDARLREALDAFMSGFPESRVESIVASELARAAAFLDGKKLRVRRRALGPDAVARVIRKALPTAILDDSVEDESLPAAGLVVETTDGVTTMKATLDLVAQILLGERRGELAAALCGEALNL